MLANSNRPKTEVLEQFYALLKAPGTDEIDWQRFFDQNPFVLTDSLPLKVANIFSHIRLESGVPDYVFFEHQCVPPIFDTCGIVELKKPKDSILKVYSTRHIVPSQTLNTALFQAERYISDLKAGRILDKRISFALGNATYCFIIIGKSEEVSLKCQKEVFQLQFKNLLPPGFQVIPYDVLWQRFKATVPSKVIFLQAEPLAERNPEPLPSEAIEKHYTQAGYGRVWRNAPEAMTNVERSRSGYRVETDVIDVPHVWGKGGGEKWTHKLIVDGGVGLVVDVDWSYYTYGDDSEDYANHTIVAIELYDESLRELFEALKTAVDKLEKASSGLGEFDPAPFVLP